MKRLGLVIAVALVGVMALVTLAQAQIVIGSFDAPRSRAPLTTASEVGGMGYNVLRVSLLDPDNFGPGGIVPCSVTIAAGTNEITPSYLADKNVFFTSVFTGDLSGSEAAAIDAFVANGGVVIVDANSIAAEQSAANSLLAAIGASASMGSPACGSGSNGGTIANVNNVVTNGPFGDVRNGTFGTTPTAVVTPGSATVLVTCASGGANLRAVYLPGDLGAGSGLVMLGGDPAAFNLFTDDVYGGAYNPNNEILYLNAIASACARIIVDIKPGSCPNPLAVKSKGVLPVAIVGTAYFDVTTVDPETARLEGVEPLKWEIMDSTEPPATGQPCFQAPLEYTGDGYSDLVLYFDTQAVVTALGSVDDAQVITLTLTADLFSGGSVQGSDDVVIVKKGNK